MCGFKVGVQKFQKIESNTYSPLNVQGTVFKVMTNFKFWFWNVKFLHMNLTSRKLRPWGTSHQMVYNEFCLEKNVWYTPALNPSNSFSILSLHDRMIMQCQHHVPSCNMTLAQQKQYQKYQTGTPKTKLTFPNYYWIIARMNPIQIRELMFRDFGDRNPHVPWSKNSDEMKYLQRKGNPAVLAVTASYNLATFLLPR